MKIKISILGSTGSIGCNTLDLLNKKRSSFKIKFLSANENFNTICRQIKKFKPEFYLINKYSIYKKVKKNLKIKILKF